MSRDAGISETLRWTQPHMLRDQYRLMRGEQVVGSLTFRSGWGTLATAEHPAGSWTFKRVGFLRTRVTVRAVGTDSDLATFHPTTWSGGGAVELPDGRHFKIAINFWQTRFDILDEAGLPLLRYRPDGVFRKGADMDVLPAGTKAPEHPWLMMLGWYLAVLMHRDAGAAAV